jgi:hypothetical protein
MIERIFEPWALVALLAAGGIGFGVGSLMGHLSGGPTRDAVFRGFEGAVLAVAGGLLARAFVSILLGLGGDSPAVRLVVGWALFLIPGAIDTIPTLLGDPLFGTGFYLWLATGVGAFSGLMDGIWRIYRWSGTGVFAFVADHTWGLAGTTTGSFFHLVNLVLTDHAWGAHEERAGAHRYLGGFRFKRGYACTQGAVMSNMRIAYDGGNVVDYHPLTDLFRHERIHVMQNRIFGPLFTLLYLGWMPLLLPAGLIAAKVKGVGAGDGVMWYSYYNNPYEVWAYRYGGHRDPNHPLCWRPATAIAAAGPFALGATALLALWAVRAWG